MLTLTNDALRADHDRMVSLPFSSYNPTCAEGTVSLAACSTGTHVVP